jgi:hypothetical protein
LIITRAQIENVRVGVGCRLSFDSAFSCGESVARKESAILFATSASTPKISVNCRS